MYDMISNESYLLKPQPLAEQVYNSLHWGVQRIFKNAVKTVTNYTKSILEFSEEDIPYEKRIFLMKVPKSVKLEVDKYKEIVNKGLIVAQNHNSDGLLRIPFDVFCKEPILQKLGELKTEYSHLISGETMPVKLEDDSNNESTEKESEEDLEKTKFKYYDIGIDAFLKKSKVFACDDDILTELKKMKFFRILNNLLNEFNIMTD